MEFVELNTIKSIKDISYFPGCSLATSARENNLSLIEVARHLGYNLVELEDWNCCGSSSTHSIKGDLAFQLACRNLSLCPSDRPLLVACPSCILRLKTAQLHLKNDPGLQHQYQDTWGRPVDMDLEIIHFFELLTRHFSLQPRSSAPNTLKGLRFVPYYGCMLNRPPEMRHEKNYYGLVEKILAYFGAESRSWPFSSRCCGTFLSVAKPAVVTPMVNRIMQGAIDTKADCVITACAMCQLNLEIRCTLKNQIPTFHFSEILSMALGLGIKKSWLSSHLVDPRPLLKIKKFI
jgi:heterodisulfide reductase subunit B2